MARKRRIMLTAKERHESEMYKRKLRSYKQELPSSSGLADAAAGIGEQENQRGTEAPKRKNKSDKQELPSSSASGVCDTATTDEPLPYDTPDVIYVPRGQVSFEVVRCILQLPPSLTEDEKRKYTFKSPYPQRFSIPENIIYYIARNVISYGSQHNLLRTCKLLFRMFRIISVVDVRRSENGIVLYSCSGRHVNITYDILKKLNIKFQIYGDIFVGNQSNPYLASALTQRIHKCSPEYLMIEYQNLTFKEIQILAGGNRLRKIVFTKNVVKNADGSITDFEKIFEAFLCVNMHFELPTEHGIGKNTAKKMAEIIESKKDLWRFCLVNVPEIFDGQLFARLLKPNICTNICIEFSDTISTAYKNQLRQFINQFYGNNEDPPISFLGLDDDDIQVY